MVTQARPIRTFLFMGAMGLLTLLVRGISMPARAESVVQLTEPFTSRDSGVKETSLGDLAADAVRSAGGAQVALVHAEALRPIDLPRGPARVNSFLRLLTFSEDPVVVLTLRGDVIIAALQRSVSALPSSSPGFLQVSGLAYTLNAGAKVGSRVGTIEVDGRPLDRAGSYTVAMPRSLAEGAAGYFLVWPANAPSHTLSATLADALTEYLSEHETLAPSAPRIIP